MWIYVDFQHVANMITRDAKSRRNRIYYFKQFPLFRFFFALVNLLNIVHHAHTYTIYSHTRYLYHLSNFVSQQHSLNEYREREKKKRCAPINSIWIYSDNNFHSIYVALSIFISIGNLVFLLMQSCHIKLQIFILNSSFLFWSELLNNNNYFH